MIAKRVLLVELLLMGTLVGLSLAFPSQLVAFLRSRPDLYLHVKLAHVLAATLFFGNVVIGTIWETRSLLSKNAVLVRHTYETVAWLDAFFTAPLILVAVTSGLALGTMLGGVFSMGWLTLAFGLFVLSGLVWLAFDIPTQRRVKSIFAESAPDSPVVSAALTRVLRFRLGLNLCAIVPLLVVFSLMVHKPAVPSLRLTGGGADARSALAGSAPRP